MALNELVEEYASEHMDPHIERPLNIVNLGSIGCGKTTLLWRIHQILGYYRAGVPINSDRHESKNDRWDFKKTEGFSAGFENGVDPYRWLGFRRGATFTLDSATIWGHTPEGFVNITLVAPAGHTIEIEYYGKYPAKMRELKELYLPEHIDGIVYQVDNSLIKLINKKPRLLQFQNVARAASDYFKRVEGINTELEYERALIIFKGEGMYALLRSIMLSSQVLEKYKGHAPAVGMRTHMPSGLLDSPETEIQKFQDRLNEAFESYSSQLRTKQERKDRFLRQSVENGYFPLDRRLSFYEDVDVEWENFDLLDRRQRITLVEFMYDLCVEILEKKGIDTEGFKLVRFSNTPLLDDVSIHYRDAIKE